MRISLDCDHARARLFALGCVLFASACNSNNGDPGDGGVDAAPTLPAWISNSQVLVPGLAVTNPDCRTGICRHNENTDLTIWNGAIYFVHRTAMSQVLGPNSALHIYRSTDGAATFTQVALIPAPEGTSGDGGAGSDGGDGGQSSSARDIRDPAFFQIGGSLFVKALTRLPVTSERDTGVDTIAVVTSTTDGTTWTPIQQVGPHGWSFWRPKQSPATGDWYSTAYQDGDAAVALYTTKDGYNWSFVSNVYTVTADTPLETELTFLPSGTLFALVRMDGTDAELLGNFGRLRTNVCISKPPDFTFTCPEIINGQRLDGPLSFMWKNRFFVIARKHLSTGDRKRTSLFELTGNFDTGTVAIQEWGELPSAGDTSYAGAAVLDDNRYFVTWYSSDLELDESWIFGMLDATDIRSAVLDLSKLQ